MNARENPFCSHLLEQLPFRFSGGDSMAALRQRLVDQKFVGAIVGPHGAGKTTLLEELVPWLEEQGMEPVRFRLRAESSMREKEQLPRQLREVKAPQIILLDGAEQLSTRMWLPARAAASEAAGFLITVHRVSRLPTVMQCETHAHLLRELVQALTDHTLPQVEAETIFARHHGNVRECFRELYDRWAGDEAGAADEAVN